MIENAEMTKVGVRLLDEGVDASRWVPAKKIEKNIYQLFPTPNYDPEDETWEFLPGAKVICEEQEHSIEGKILMAVRLA